VGESSTEHVVTGDRRPPWRVALKTGQVNDNDAQHLSDLFAAVCNWGRWGPNDERGTLNYVTPDKARHAAALVKRGVVISAAHLIDMSVSRKNSRPALLSVDDRQPGAIAATDSFTISVHSVTVTHLDAIAHVFFGNYVYNGRHVDDAVRADGLHFASVLAQSYGTVTRAVLLDVARARELPYLDSTDTVTVDDLVRAEGLAACHVEPGDAVLVRVGLGARERVQGAEDPAERAGLTVDCLRWLHERQVAIYGGDCFDKLPSPYPGLSHPFHAVGLAAMGLVMIDNVAMESVAEECQRQGRSSFMFVMAPLRIPNGTGSALNPLCVF
jgi:kynurenine formamidase